jgi:hypothetical protein
MRFMLFVHAYIEVTELDCGTRLRHGVALTTLERVSLFLLFLQEIISGGWLFRRRNPGISATDRAKEQRDSNLFPAHPLKLL